MNSTTIGNRKHITIYGKRNTGKSSLINAITEQEISIVSDFKGTTTDPVSKAMELLPLGPVMLTDTAGVDDLGDLGEKRIEKTLKTLQSTDLAIYVLGSDDLDNNMHEKILLEFKKYNILHILVINKIDLLKEEQLNKIKQKYNNAICTSTREKDTIIKLKEAIVKAFDQDSENGEKDTIIGEIVKERGNVVMIIPIDTEAPKGRLILPQVQLLRDCLDNGIRSLVISDNEIDISLEDIKNCDMVITDSNIFKQVEMKIPKDIPLTSYSVLFANYKGDLNSFVKGAQSIERLNKDSKVLICETCTHNTSHEDIGKVKIPKMLNKFVGYELEYTYSFGKDFPKDIENYSLVIHCGGCMVNKNTVIRRINACKEKNIPITNYGIIIAYLNGIIERAIEFIDKK